MYEQATRSFKILPYYPISNKEELKNLILNHPDGLEVDERLKTCYNGVLDDIIALRDEGWCRELYPRKIT